LSTFSLSSLLLLEEFLASVSWGEEVPVQCGEHLWSGQQLPVAEDHVWYLHCESRGPSISFCKFSGEF
jgi:hypothetical protein